MARQKKDSWGGRGRRSQKGKPWGAAAIGGRKRREFGQVPGRQRRAPFPAKPSKKDGEWVKLSKRQKKEQRAVRRWRAGRGIIDRFFPRRSQLTLRRYYQRIDNVEYEKLRGELAKQVAGNPEELRDLMRAVTGKPLSPTAQSRIRQWIERRTARLQAAFHDVANVIDTVLAMFGRRRS